MPTDTVVLRVRDARKAFGSVPALQGASFELREGELLGLLGPNGAGKTTLVRAVAGRVRLDAGEVELLGRRLAGADGRAELGVVPQELAVYPLLTAKENLEVFGRLHGVAPREEQERLRVTPVSGAGFTPAERAGVWGVRR